MLQSGFRKRTLRRVQPYENSPTLDQRGTRQRPEQSPGIVVARSRATSARARPQCRAGICAGVPVAALAERILSVLFTDSLGGSRACVCGRVERPRAGHGQDRLRHRDRDPGERCVFLLAGVPGRKNARRVATTPSAEREAPAGRQGDPGIRGARGAGRHRRARARGQRSGGLPAGRGFRRAGRQRRGHR